MANKKYNFSNPVVFRKQKKEVMLEVRRLAKRQCNWTPQHVNDIFLNQYPEFYVSPFVYWYNCKGYGIKSIESMAQEIFEYIKGDSSCVLPTRQGGQIHGNE